MKNKISIYVLIILAFVSFQTFSQVQVALGIKGGLNFAKIDGSSSLGDNYKNRTGYHGGAFLLIKIAKIGIQPEVIFSKQGSNYDFSSSNVEANYDYINVPIIIKLYLVAGLNLQVGPQFGFLTAGELKTTAGSISTTADAKKYYSGADISAALGAGWDLPFGLTIDGRYNLGIKNNQSSDASLAPDYKNQVIQISLGYKLFKFGK